jgi:hypothetical protein
MSIKNTGMINRSAKDTLYKRQKRISSKFNENITIGKLGATSLLEVCYPLGFNKSTQNYAPWMAADPTVLVASLVSASSGTWTVTVNGITTADIAYNATAVAVAAALLAIGYVTTVVLDTAEYTISFDADAQVETVPTVTGTVTSITGGSPTAVATAGTSTNGTDKIRCFVNPEDIQVGTDTGDIALTRETVLATATTDQPHNLVSGMVVTVSDADAPFNVTAEITVLTSKTYTYAVSDSGAVTSTGYYTTTNDVIALAMFKGEVHYEDVAALVATADIAALQMALRDDLKAVGLFVQALVSAT